MKNNTNIYFREQPSIVIPDNIDVPEAEIHTAANGVKIYSIPATEYDVVRFSFIFGAGSSAQDVAFCASTTANMLAEGSSSMTAAQISEQLDYYGSYFDVSLDRDWCVITFVCLSKFFDRTLAIAREVLLDPQFPEEELRTYTAKSRQTLLINRTKTDFNAREVFARSLFGAAHPYGASSDALLYDKLRREDLLKFYKKYYTAENCFVVASGNIDDTRLKALEDFAAQLPGNPDTAHPEFPIPVSQPAASKKMEGAVQTAIRIGRVLFPREHPDFIGMQVAATVLGGYFGSRLVRNLREEHGYTYGAYSAMVNFNRSGYIAIATEVGTQFSEDAVRQIFVEIERLRTESVPEEELSLVKNIMAGEVMRILDGPFGIADVTIENIQTGFGNSYIKSFIDEVRAVTPEQVLSLAVKYLNPKDLTTVTVGAV